MSLELLMTVVKTSQPHLRPYWAFTKWKMETYACHQEGSPHYEREKFVSKKLSW
jgi:hypothetical protein